MEILHHHRFRSMRKRNVAFVEDQLRKGAYANILPVSLSTSVRKSSEAFLGDAKCCYADIQHQCELASSSDEGVLVGDDSDEENVVFNFSIHPHHRNLC